MHYVQAPCSANKCTHSLSNRNMAPKVGIEPTTNGLTVRCTTAVLLWNVWLAYLGSNQGPSD